MTTETMTIHEALCELKVSGKRIDKLISDTEFVTLNKHSNTKIDGKTITSYNDDIKSSYQKIIDLINRRNAIKRAVIKSNAETYVDINGQKMTVAEAIEYKKIGLLHLENLLDRISGQFKINTFNVSKENAEADAKSNQYVINLFGNKDTNGVDNKTIEAAKKSYIEANTYDLIDPLNAQKIIAKLNDHIDSFNTKVDSALSVSNATTTITISY